jgi:hypothetical protein
MPRPIVDRVTELKIFAAALEGASSDTASVLLLRDHSGQGKSRLLERYGEYCREHKIPVAHVDLKGGSLSPVDILWTIEKDLRPVPLPRCVETLRTVRLVPPIHISGNRAIGRTEYTVEASINLTGLSPEEQKQWWAASAQAFIDDLMEYAHAPQKRCALLFDTFEKAQPDTQTWITDHLLRMATPYRVSSLVIVLAGQQVPDPAGEWEPFCQILSLERLQLQDWLDYAKLVRASLTREQIIRFYDKFRDKPIMMAQIIDAQREAA